MTSHLQQLFSQALENLGITDHSAIQLEHPADTTHGDYSTNVAMQLFSQIKNKVEYTNPRELAQGIVEHASKLLAGDDSFTGLSGCIKEISVAGPGFINISFRDAFFVSQLSTILEKGTTFGTNQSLKGKTVVVEYTDPNPFKEFHIGHLYSNIVGESIARLFENSGATVVRADFFGDVGMHAAKSLWGLLQNFADDEIDLENLAAMPLKERIAYLGKSYARGATAYKEDEAAAESIKQLNFLLFKAAQEIVLPQFDEPPQVDFDQFITSSECDFESIKQIYAMTRKWSLDYFEEIYARLGTRFDNYYPESRTGEEGYQMVLAGLKKGIFETGENGAIIFPGEKYGLHNRVFINALGLPTYETKDFGLALLKERDIAPDFSIIVTGNEINEYFAVILKSLGQVAPALAQYTTHIAHGMVRLPEGKMSSRTGKIFRGEWLLDEAVESAHDLLTSPSADVQHTSDLAEQIGQAAIKFAFLKQNVGGDIAFDFAESVSFEGNSGPYVQYAHARTQSIIRKSGGSIPQISGAASLLPAERSLAQLLYQLPEVLLQAAETYQPHLVAQYLFAVAQAFNSFYAAHSVLGENVTSEQKQLRLALTMATGVVLKNGLLVLGIAAPDRM